MTGCSDAYAYFLLARLKQGGFLEVEDHLLAVVVSITACDDAATGRKTCHQHVLSLVPWLARPSSAQPLYQAGWIGLVKWGHTTTHA